MLVSLLMIIMAIIAASGLIVLGLESVPNASGLYDPGFLQAHHQAQ
jgi:hypothetical protein